MRPIQGGGQHVTDALQLVLDAHLAVACRARVSLLEKCPERVAQCEQALARIVPPAKLEAAFQQEVIWDLLTEFFMTFEGGHLQPKCTQSARRALQSDCGHPGSSYSGRTSGTRPGAYPSKVVCAFLFFVLASYVHYIGFSLLYWTGQHVQKRLRTKSSL